MSVAEELIVQIKTEGVDTARDTLSAMSEAIDDVVGGIQEGTSGLTDFIGGFRGSLAAIIAGVAIVGGALATQIPVISELLAGLGAVATAVGLEIDEDLRPALLPIVDGLYDLSTAIMEAETTAGYFDAIRENLGPALVALTAFVAALGLLGAGLSIVVGGLGSFVQAGSALGTVLSPVIAGLATFLGVSAAVAAAIFVVVAAIAVFAAAWYYDVGATREITAKVVDKIKGYFDDMVDYVKGLWDRAKEGFNDFKRGLLAWAAQIKAEALAAGKAIGNNITEGINAAIPGSRFDLELPFDPAETETYTPAGSQYGTMFGSGGDVYMDGQKVSEETARYFADPSFRRGL